MYAVYTSGNDFKLILTVEMETRRPVEGYFGNKFRAICNHCGVMAARCRKTWKFAEEFLRFFGKTTPRGNIFKILFRTLSSRHRSTLFCLNFVKFGRREIGEMVRHLPDKKFGCLSNCRYCADRAQNMALRQCTESASDFIQIGSFSAEL